LEGSANRPFRELIEHHINNQTTSKLQQAVLYETSLLPDELQSLIMDYIDETNSRWEVGDVGSKTT
jgi:hypothetical protein